MSEASENTAAPTEVNTASEAAKPEADAPAQVVAEAAEATPPETPADAPVEAAAEASAEAPPDTTTNPAPPTAEEPVVDTPSKPETANTEALPETGAATDTPPSNPETTTDAAPDAPKAPARPIIAESIELPPMEKLPEPSGDVHEVGLMAKMPNEKTVLVIQTDGQVRGTLAGGCRTLQWVTVHTASSVELGEELIKEESIDAIILALDEGAEAIDLLTRIRLGECKVDAGVPVMTINHEATAELVGQLKSLGVTRLLLHPFTLGEVLETVEGMWTPDGAPVVMPANLEALKKAAEADKPDDAKATASEGDLPAEPDASREAPAEETKAEAETEGQAEPEPA